MESGYIQVYTGNGKGKTTASFGVALRSVGAGYQVYIGQFMKNGDYSEIKAFEQLHAENLTVEQYGHGGELSHIEKEQYERAVKEGFMRATEVVESGAYDLIILDEINVAVYLNYIALEDVLALMKKKKPTTELILTGRYASPEVMELADLVTEMTEVKHYYKNGVPARVGIEK